MLHPRGLTLNKQLYPSCDYRIPDASLTPGKWFDWDPFAAATEKELHAPPYVVRTLIGRVSNGKSRRE